VILKPEIGRIRVPLENPIVRGTGIPETIAIDEITAHDGTVTAITEEEMKGENEMRDETGRGETATDIATIGPRIAKDAHRMPTSDDVVLQSLPGFHPMVHHGCEGPPTPIGKRASEYHLSLAIFGFDNTHRISPPLRGSSPSPRKILESKPPLNTPPLNTARPTQPGPEFELATSPVPIEVTLAARRAKRQAIHAKYAGVASVNMTQASPSPGPSSAVQPPPPSVVVSDPQSQRHSVIGENGVGSTSRDQSVDPSSESSQIFFPFGIYAETCDPRPPRVPIRIAGI
jgi:hypothetical protein